MMDIFLKYIASAILFIVGSAIGGAQSPSEFMLEDGTYVGNLYDVVGVTVNGENLDTFTASATSEEDMEFIDEIKSLIASGAFQVEQRYQEILFYTNGIIANRLRLIAKMLYHPIYDQYHSTYICDDFKMKRSTVECNLLPSDEPPSQYTDREVVIRREGERVAFLLRYNSSRSYTTQAEYFLE